MMTLSYPLLPASITFVENKISVLIIENPVELRHLLINLREQVNGFSGNMVLAENYQPIEISTHAVLLTELFSLDFLTRKIANKVYESVCEISSAYTEQIQHIMMELNQIAASIALNMEFETGFVEFDDPKSFLKQFNFYVDTSELSFVEQLLLYIKIQHRLFCKKLTILYNLKACLTIQELEEFYQAVQYEKLTILLIEDTQRNAPLLVENTIIVDQDLCVF